MRITIAIAVAITIALAATQAHGWAQDCADGNTDACCHLEQRGWDTVQFLKLISIHQQILLKQMEPDRPCSTGGQKSFDDMIPLMCQTDCWGGAVGIGGSWNTMPSHAEVLSAGCTLNFVNKTCPPPVAPPAVPSAVSSTASASVSSTASAHASSTAPAPESSSSSSTATQHIQPGATSGRDDDHAYVNAAAAAAASAPFLAALALALAFVLGH